MLIAQGNEKNVTAPAILPASILVGSVGRPSKVSFEVCLLKGVMGVW